MIKLIKDNKLVILILLLALVMRLVVINQSLWLDEAIGAIAVRDFSFSEIVTDFIKSDNHPPLYYLDLKSWTAIFGYSEVALRLHSVLYGVLTVYVTYLIARKLTRGKSKLFAIISSLLLATSPFHIYYSQEARMYCLAAFLASLAVYSFLFLIESTKSRLEYWILFSFSVTALVFTDYVPVFLLPVFWIIGWLKRKNRQWWLKFLTSHIPLLILGIAWLPIFLIQVEGGRWLLGKLPGWRDIAGGATFKQAVLVWMKFVFGRISLMNKKLYYFLVGLASIPVLVSMYNTIKHREKKLNTTASRRIPPVSVLGDEPQLRRRWSSNAAYKSLSARLNFSFRVSKETPSIRAGGGFILIWLWLVFPLTMGFIASFWFPVFIYFRFVYVIPAFYLIISWGVYRVKPITLRRLLMIFLLLVNITGWLIYVVEPYQQREQWRQATGFVEKRGTRDDVVIFEFPEPFAPYRWYAKGKIEAVGVTNSISADKDETVDKTKRTITGKSGVYYFEYLRDLSDPQRIVEETLRNSGFEVSEVFDLFPGVGQVFYWTK